jgi:hypothetical protein
MNAGPVVVIVDEPGTPRFHVRIVCPRCEAILAVKTYNVREVGADDEAVADATRALEHRCQGH